MAKRIPQLNESDKARFWSRIDVRDLDECWPWIGSTFWDGYGQFWLAGYNVKASRVALTLEKEASELCALHSCDNPPCCNPAHLRWGTNLENHTDAKLRNRKAKGLKNGSHTVPEQRRVGVTNGRAKLTDDAVRAIRSSSARQVDLAAFFGVSKSMISAVIRRKNWKHVL